MGAPGEISFELLVNIQEYGNQELQALRNQLAAEVDLPRIGGQPR